MKRRTFESFAVLAKCRYCKGGGTVVEHRGVGAYVKSLRREKSLRLQDVANAVGISTTYLCELENDAKRWHPRMFKRVCNAIYLEGRKKEI